MSAAPKRWRGRTVAVAIGLLIFVIVTGLLLRWYLERWPTGTISAIRVAGDDRAIVLRLDDEGAFAQQMVMLDREDGPAWATGIYALQEAGSRGITVGDGVITVRAVDTHGGRGTHAFSQDTGEFLWKAGDMPGQAEPQSFGASWRNGSLLYEVYGRPDLLVVGIDASSGDERFRQRMTTAPGPGHLQGWLRGEALLLRTATGNVLRVASDGTMGVLLDEGDRLVCVLADRVIYSTRDAGVYSYPLAPEGGSGPRDGAASLLWRPAEASDGRRNPISDSFVRSGEAEACGVFDGRIRILNFEANGGVHIYSLPPTADGELQAADIGHGRWPSAAATTATWEADAQAFALDLPRFVPIAVAGRQDGAHPPTPGEDTSFERLVVFDLERDRVVRRARLPGITTSVRTPTGSLIRSGSHVFTLGGDDGEIAAAVRIDGMLPADQFLLPMHLHDNLLWIHDGLAARALSAETLRPLHGAARSPQVIDARDQIDQWLLTVSPP